MEAQVSGALTQGLLCVLYLGNLSVGIVPPTARKGLPSSIKPFLEASSQTCPDYVSCQANAYAAGAYVILGSFAALTPHRLLSPLSPVPFLFQDSLLCFVGFVCCC